MPINDSAGVGVYLKDKSQRASTAIGFRSAGAVEADRGLCNTPIVISSEDEYVKNFGTPTMERHGLAAMEAYLLAQQNVPQVLTRAKDPEMDANATPFGVMRFSVADNKLVINSGVPGKVISAPAEDNEVLLYFKGEGTYCKDNVVVRFSEPTTKSAYEKAGHSIRMQVYDFNGSAHIDEDVCAELAFSPDISSLLDTNGLFKLDGFLVGQDETMSQPVNVSTVINGRKTTLAEFDYKTIQSSTTFGMFDKFSAAVKAATYADGTHIIKSGIGSDVTWAIPFEYYDNGPTEGSGSDLDGTYGMYYLYSGEEGSAQELNCLDLSIVLTAKATLSIAVDTSKGSRTLQPGFYNYPCGTVVIKPASGNKYTAEFTVKTSLYLKNRNSYMFMGKQNSFWASYYSTYCKEDYCFSLSYDDYDANYISIQADSVINDSKYIVAKSSESFDAVYTIDYTADDLVNNLQYFSGNIAENKIGASSKSYAYSQALVKLLSDNLTRWRCVATPNMGDVMTPADFLTAVESANESTLGTSNIGRAAATDAFSNLTGRHGNRFIADYSQYAYRNLAGKRIAVTMATLVADLLNSHYNNGIEARPPFGYNYGQIACLGLSQQFSGAERNILARQYKINPVIEDGGYFIWEERTSQLTDTSLSDIHCIVSFIWMKYAIYDAMKTFVAEYNDASTVNRGLTLLNQLNQTFISRNYIEEGIVSADKNVIGDEVIRFDYAIRFKGVARFVDVYITAYSQTQTLAISLAQEA